jgi:hypothetical protein
MTENVDTKSPCDKCGRLHADGCKEEADKVYGGASRGGKTAAVTRIEAGVLNLPIEDGTGRDRGKTDEVHPGNNKGDL